MNNNSSKLSKSTIIVYNPDVMELGCEILRSVSFSIDQAEQPKSFIVRLKFPGKF